MNEPTNRPRPEAPGRVQIDRKRMAELLVAEGILTEEQVRVAVNAHDMMGRGSRFGDYLQEMGLLSKRDLSRILGRQFNLDVVSLANLHPEPAALELVGRGLAERLGALPLSVADGQLTVAVSDPLDFGVPKVLASETRLRVRIVLAPEEDIKDALRDAWTHIEAASAGPRAAEVRPPVEAEWSPTGPVAEILTQLLRNARDSRSIELILAPEAEGLRVQTRGPAGLRTVANLPADRAAALLSDLRTRMGLTPAAASVPREGRGTVVVDGVPMPVELSLLPTLRGERALLCLEPHTAPPPDLAALPMTRSHLALVDSLLGAPGGGVFLAVGMPGEDLRSLLLGVGRRVDPERRVTALIEEGRATNLPQVIQVQVRPGSGGLSYAQALSAVLRHQPDVILLADVRDRETAALAFEAALAGAWVVAGVHATSPAQALDRLGQLGVDGGAMARALKAVCFQRWVARICGGCREQVIPSRADLKALGLTNYEGQVQLAEGRGCPSCDDVGSRGEVAIHALAALDPEDSEHLIRREPAWSLFTRLGEALVYDAAAKAVGGYVTAAKASQVLGVS